MLAQLEKLADNDPTMMQNVSQSNQLFKLEMNGNVLLNYQIGKTMPLKWFVVVLALIPKLVLVNFDVIFRLLSYKFSLSS